MSAAGPIVVVARWRMAPEVVADVLALVTQLREQSLAESGCQGYDAFQSVGVPGELLLLERYADRAAIEAHRASAHYQELVVKRILPLLAERQVQLLREEA
ncbi:putative quinol monooxygenase [Mitsuaria sp. GD03876]|uniref:putative quinol monooxygenase n=1 Tax=Mitsuaria sp. GD03876 TaxID=2975399 RepID=UPI002446F931|nr:putative quinol monooxygenase [Mitsuaria sp. GD03876]MDH0867377.1 antibiotic biosynthesis monooxygenase [Mitsuaria sp. GD03876]